MKKILPPLLLTALLILPAVLFAGLSFFGERHPLEKRVVEGVPFLENSGNQVEVVFFGYAGCSFICPNALIKAAGAMDSLRTERPGISAGITFVDINAQTQLNRAETYGKSFSNDIRGINTDAELLEKLKKDFSLRIKSDPVNPYDIDHTDHFYILNKKEGKWRISRVLANISDKKTLEHAIISAL
ncbi:SCO family protein [Gracilimonas mengyeensis]|nr:SCO family protein [Gracilimonas mengyeensis]